MINEEKVKCMTKAAVYENGPEKKNISIDGYFKGDYMGLQMVKSALAYTAAFCILAAIWGMSNIEEVSLKISQAEYLNHLIKIVIILFAVGLVFYEIAIYIYYLKKYQSAKQSVKEFHTYLKKIHKFYEAEESAEAKMADEENGL